MIEQEITFTEDVEVLDADDNISFSAKAGETKTLPMPSCKRWERRGKAVFGKVSVETRTEGESDTTTLKPLEELTDDDMEELTANEIKQYLDQAEVEYKTSDKKDVLFGLLLDVKTDHVA